MTNRLAKETSPYLLQHAENPVEWFPWGEEALALACERDRPILLSIGYSACHWCHVMERESFEDARTARLMNRSFVNIKVDREERPDLDSIYMRAVQAMTGQGGWPLTAFLTPGGVPYYGGTYFPPAPRHGLPSFRQVLATAAGAWESRREAVVRAGDRIRDILKRSSTEPQPSTGFDASGGQLFSGAVSSAGRSFDPGYGGFGGAPKFPQPVFLDFLLRTGTAGAPGVSMACHTLSRMAAGGIRDHVGGGFHRYSVDARWLVPHFEKMLYDNALIVRALVRAHLLGAVGLGRVAEETLDYVLEDLASPDGGFYSSRDADSEGEEGAFYVWTPGELASLLDRDTARIVSRVYDVSETGNFEGRNILHLPHDLEAVARQEGMARKELDAVLNDALGVLKAHRNTRPKPLRDEKVLTCWNGFAIRALAEAGPALGRPDYTEASARAADFLLHTVYRNGRLFRVLAAGRVHVQGFLEDYGSLGNACLSLYEATLNPRWMEEAVRIADAMVNTFWSSADALFFDASGDGEPLWVRPRDITDNATPSGNSLAAELLVRSAAVTGSPEHERLAEKVIARERGTMERYPTAAGRLLTAALLSATPRLAVSLAGPPEGVGAMLLRAHRHAHPNRVILGGDPENPAVAALPAMEGRLDRVGEAVVCEGPVCSEPMASPEALGDRLKRVKIVTF